ncbi:hydroxyacylglutathione hydrolase [Parvularcula sp. ZS-1/3]|uniref:Hydroxyacylglutathione hydrolase n=1 Tax=Parvularcula mediterranea TaxID=2732508 RepID=A0A7Y3RM05_9PROT|nr:hydroxyacylglutathione hydrolase [Parvularcula mediterranea]NNU16016.1 hydroxyacylglutathione hydrolase [Parvularcula mediterranea]
MHHLGPLTVHQFPCLQDNYGFLVRDEASGKVATIDTPEAARIEAEAEKLGWGIDLILNTHWHLDHIGGNAPLKERFGAEIVAPEGEGDKIPGADRRILGGDHVMLGETRLDVIAVPGHTLGHIAYHAPEAKLAFVGDTLFSLGCGRMFEGDKAGFWASLQKLRALPEETTIFCAHEYTKANAAFAMSVDAGNEALKARTAEVARLREEGTPTVPVALAEEKKANPFLRADDPALAASLGLSGAPAEDVFAELRSRKDSF